MKPFLAGEFALCVDLCTNSQDVEVFLRYNLGR